jgi:type I restriction enzyme, S subunit
MKTKIVSSSWIYQEGLRLDCGPYMSGALEARILLDHLSVAKQSLESVCKGGLAGIYHAGREPRRWVTNRSKGVPFLGSTDILASDLSVLPFISKEQVKANPLLLIHQGWILITRTGTIGRMAYSRSDMDGLACSEHVMRVVPDPEIISPGYLYAYLSSRFGLPLIIGGTYGSIIQSIEPHHIAKIPIPRLAPIIESETNQLVQEAADARTLAIEKRAEALKSFIRHFTLSDLSTAPISINRAIFHARAEELSRMDAAYFSPVSRNAATELRLCSGSTRRLGDIARVFTPGIFKRQHVDDSHYGYAYFSGSELFHYETVPRGYLSRRAPKISDYLVERDWLLIQDAGQLGGLIGRIVRVTPATAGGVVSNHLIRIVAENEIDAAFIFIVLSSPHGYRAIIRNAFGTSIPQLDPTHIGAIDIPWPTENERRQLAEPVLEAWEMEDFATEAIRKAIRLVESAIEEGAN